MDRDEALRDDFLGFLRGIELPASLRINDGAVLFDEGELELLLVHKLAASIAIARSQRTSPPERTFAEDLRARWPGRFDCEVFCDPGWHDLLAALSEMLDTYFKEGEPIAFRQVKEKFGTLRAYRSAPSYETAFGSLRKPNAPGLPYVLECVTAAEILSERVCEKCGAPGQLRIRDGCWFTSCAGHDREGSSPAPNPRGVRKRTDRVRRLRQGST